MEGHGVFTWNDGRVYEGNFSDDKKHGHGSMKWPDGSQYIGVFYKGKMDGAGKFKAKGALKWRSGLWKKGNRVQWEARDEDATIRTIDKDGDREEASEFQDVKKLDVTNTV